MIENNFTGFITLNVIGPEGWKLLFIVVVLIVALMLFFVPKKKNKIKSKIKQPLIKFRRIEVNIEKDKLYYPDYLTLSIKNRGNTDVDIDRPLLIFDNFWYKRKFKLRGYDGYDYYPLYLEKGKTHIHKINLLKFYTLDKKLMSFPKITIIIFTVNRKQIVKRSLFLRKTLIPF